jgi:hypothetical protein
MDGDAPHGLIDSRERLFLGSAAQTVARGETLLLDRSRRIVQSAPRTTPGLGDPLVDLRVLLAAPL